MNKSQPTNRSFMAKLTDFWNVQVWVQKIRYQALGKWYFLELIMKIANRITPLLSSFIIGLIINEVVNLASQQNKDLTTLMQLVGSLLLIYLSHSIFSYLFQNRAWLKIDRKFRIYINSMIIDKLSYLSWEHIETPKVEKLINMTSQKSAGIIPQIISIHIDVLSIIITIILAFSLTSIPFFVIPILIIMQLPIALTSSKERKLIYITGDQQQQESIRMNSVIGYFRNFRTLLEIKMSSVTKTLIKFRNDKIKSLEQGFEDAIKINDKIRPFLGMISPIFKTGTYTYYLYKVIYEGMLIGTFSFTTSAIFRLSDSIGDLFSNTTRLVDNYRYVRYAYDLMQVKNKQKEGDIKFEGEITKIEFKNVWFKYPLSENWSLQNINFIIEDNDRIALVGENGAGKSTFLKLMMLAYTPTKGTIFINEIPIEKYTKESISSMVSLVSQEFARYRILDIKQNIAIYSDIDNIDKKKLHLAAKYSTANEFIEKLPNKYDTPVTKQLEGGTELSSGQWQRLAVARQFYSNRPLVILDEPTASIDPIAEVTIFDNIYKHVKDKTVVVVSHRYNTVKAAKKILVFKEGEIIEQGTHSELIKQNGYYKKAYSMQNTEKKL